MGTDAIEDGAHKEALEERNAVQCDQALGVAKDIGQKPGRKEVELLEEVGAPFVGVRKWALLNQSSHIVHDVTMFEISILLSKF